MAARFNPPPNWPAMPQGWTPPAGWAPPAQWGPAPAGWQYWVEDYPAYQAYSYGTPTLAGGSRSTGMRLLLFFAMIVGYVVTTLVIGFVIGLVLYAGNPNISDDSPAFVFVDLLVRGATLGLLAWLCTKVAYRARDCFFALIPIYGLIFICRIVWRVSNLPYRGWPERDQPVQQYAPATLVQRHPAFDQSANRFQAGQQ